MIRFCDKVVYNIELQEVSRMGLLNFFLEDACFTNAVVAIYENGMLYGTVTYDDILRSWGGETNVECINTFFVSPSEDFWTEAREYFTHNPKKLLTIVNTNREIIGFAYNDNNFYKRVEFNIESLEDCKIADLGVEDYCYIKAIVIVDINELAYCCAKAFDKLGYRICAIGEKWEWFGYKSGEGFLDYADLKNVIVVSSDRWIVSYETLPIYFEKAIKQEANVDASKDLEIFARYIAPKLGITKRFVGEEPKDKITAQYNQQMREILGRFGIGLEEIPRKELNGEVISASSVRNYMQATNWEMVSQLVPETTYKVCLKYKKNE